MLLAVIVASLSSSRGSCAILVFSEDANRARGPSGVACQLVSRQMVARLPDTETVGPTF